MSIKLMSLVWEDPDFDPYERLVMLSLADHANDDGLCYPSIARLCQRTGMKERGVQTVIKRLVEKGRITVTRGAGKRGSNLFTIRSTPAPDAPPHRMHPAPDAPNPRTGCGSTPAPDAPKPSLNHQRTSRARGDGCGQLGEQPEDRGERSGSLRPVSAIAAEYLDARRHAR